MHKLMKETPEIADLFFEPVYCTETILLDESVIFSLLLVLLLL